MLRPPWESANTDEVHQPTLREIRITDTQVHLLRETWNNLPVYGSEPPQYWEISRGTLFWRTEDFLYWRSMSNGAWVICFRSVTLYDAVEHHDLVHWPRLKYSDPKGLETSCGRRAAFEKMTNRPVTCLICMAQR